MRTVNNPAKYLFVLWVLLNNGDCYRYTQADNYTHSKHGAYTTVRSEICDATIVEIPTNKIKKIYWHRRPLDFKKYIIYNNPKILCSYPAAWDYDIYINSHGVRVCKKVVK